MTLSDYASVQMLMGPITHWSVSRLRDMIKDFKQSKDKSEQESKHKMLDREAVMIGSYMSCLEDDMRTSQRIMVRQTKQINKLRARHTLVLKELADSKKEALESTKEFLKLRRIIKEMMK